MGRRRLPPRHASRASFPALLLLVACGPEPDAPARPGGTLSLWWTQGAARPLRVIAKIPVPGAAEAWSVQAPVAEIVEDAGGRALRMGEGRDLRALIPGPADLARCNLVRVRLAARDPVRVRLGVGEMESDGVPRVRWSDSLSVVNRGEVSTAEFELEPGPADTHLVLHVHSKFRASVDVRGVELLDSPPERRIAAIDEPPRWIELGGEARAAHALGVLRDVSAEVSVPPDGLLTLPWAPGPPLAAEGRLRVLVGSEGSENVLAELPLVGDGAAWMDERIDLAAYAGRAVRVRLSVDGPRLALIGEPKLGTRLADPPTVLLISSDTHRADHLGCATPTARADTPILDRLAAEGVLFERAFSSSNITLPSHVTLMTGTNPRDTGVIDNLTRLHERAETLAEAFRAQGWETYAAVSAIHLSPQTSGLGQGFTRMSWPREPERAARDTLRELRQWLDDAEGRALFVWLHLFDAHRPYEADLETARASYGRERDPFGLDIPEVSFPEIREARGARDVEWVRALYRAQIEELDRELDALLSHPRMRRAIVAFTADHGESLGEQGLWWDHLGANPSVLRVPLILRWPDAPAGSRSCATVAQADVARTLLDLAGLGGVPFPGEDLRAWLAPEAPELPCFAISDNAHSMAVTWGKWHLTVNLHNGADDRAITRDNAELHPVELFDLERDPDCTQDCSWSEVARTARMGEMLLQWLEEPARSLADESEPSDETRARVAALGYASGSGAVAGVGRLDPEPVRERLRPYFRAAETSSGGEGPPAHGR